METIITIIISVIVGIIAGKYLFFSNRTHELEVKVATLETSKLTLKDKITECASKKAKLQEQILECKDENSKLKIKVMEYENKDIIINDYTFNKLGFWIHKNNPNDMLCEKCLNLTPLIMGKVVVVDGGGHQCTNCNRNYYQSHSDHDSDWDPMAH